MNLTIGASSYNDFNYTKQWLESLFSNIVPNIQNKVRIVVVDDGSQDLDIVYRLRNYCHLNNVTFISHGDNRGIPAAWNTIANAFPDTQMICIFNNDTRITSPDTFCAALYFMEHNSFVGASSWPVIEVNRWTGEKSKPQYEEIAVVLHPSGCGFFLSRDAYRDTNGFWEDLISYYEEIDFGAELYKNGWTVIRMPYPPIEHFGGRGYVGYTFATNSNLEPQKRMNRAFELFVQKWQCQPNGLYPQAEVEQRLVQPKRREIRKIKYIGPKNVPLEVFL